MVKCANCGFLCLRDPDDGALIEADIDYRKKASSNAPAQYKPICFAMENNLLEEFDRKFQGRVLLTVALLEVIDVDRQCDKFTPWHQGFSPKEHREMLFDLERKKLEIQEKEAERRWEERRDKADKKFQLANTLISAFAGALFAVIVGAVAAWLTSGKPDVKSITKAPPDQALPTMPSAEK